MIIVIIFIKRYTNNKTILNKQFDKYDVENISETLDLEDDIIKKMHLNENGQNTLFDNLLQLSGPKN